MNISANILGLDNAATPMGLKAMKELQEINPGRPGFQSDDHVSRAELFRLNYHSDYHHGISGTIGSSKSRRRISTYITERLSSQH